MDGILLHDLPRTFQDAIYITNFLRVRHIWIDSLCIIQDSKEDWQREAAKMADIYHQSYLTIAASWAPCGNVGLFKQTPVLEVLGTIARPAIRHIHDDASHFPLMGRAWAYQERILSPRLLHFGPQEIA
jgi:hypothetical protein